MEARAFWHSFLWVAAVPVGLLFVISSACSQSVSMEAGAPARAEDQPRLIEIKHEPCDVQAKDAVRIDVNNDGRADITRVMSGGHEVCRAVDLNFDGRIDNYLYFDPQGQLRRRESDFDRDGVIDEIATYREGKLVRKDRETNLDHKMDTWDFFTNDVLVRRERDSNADGRVDQWWTFPDPSKPDCPIVDTDSDGDGRPDTRQDVCKEREAQQQLMAAPNATAATPSVPEPGPSASSTVAGAVASAPPGAAPGPAPKASTDRDAGTGRASDAGGGR